MLYRNTHTTHSGNVSERIGFVGNPNFLEFHEKSVSQPLSNVMSRASRESYFVILAKRFHCPGSAERILNNSATSPGKTPMFIIDALGARL